MADFSSAPFCLTLMIGNLRALEFCGPAGDHAPQRVPAVGYNQHDVRNYKHYKEHHQPKVPEADLFKSAKDRGEPRELRRFVNRPSSGDNEKFRQRQRQNRRTAGRGCILSGSWDGSAGGEPGWRTADSGSISPSAERHEHRSTGATVSTIRLRCPAPQDTPARSASISTRRASENAERRQA